MKPNFKSFISGFLMCALLMTVSIPIFAKAQAIQAYYNDIKIKVNNKILDIPTEEQAFIYNGRTYVPVSYVAKAFNATVSFNKTTNTVELTSNKEAVSFTSSASFTNALTGTSDQKIDNMTIYEKELNQFVRANDVLNLLNKQSSKEFYVSLIAEHNVNPQQIDDSTLDFKSISFSIEQLSQKGYLTIQMFDYMPCTYILMNSSNTYDPCISIEDYMQYIQPYINLSTEKLWNLFNK